MQLNQNYPWYLQTSPAFTVLYEGVYNVCKNISPLDSYKVFYPSELMGLEDNGAILKGLNTYATLWQLPTEISSIDDALIYDVDPWSSTYKWDGAVTGISVEWLFRYIKMKNFINQQQFSIQTMHDALAILFEGVDYTAEITVEDYEITVDISTDDTEATNFFLGLLASDATLVGKPVGFKITYTIS